jgi:peroxiredoxin
MTSNVPILDKQAPPLRTVQWFNTEQPITLESLKGRVVVLHAFQMLCPGCVSHGLPQAQRIRDEFDASAVSVIGLHTVFEHHEAMTPTSLAAFLHEYRIQFPVGVDEPSPHGSTPRTMEAYGMRGTPSLVLINRKGAIKHHFFGRPSDLLVGAAIAELKAEPTTREMDASDHAPDSTPTGLGQRKSCDEDACTLAGAAS